MIYIIWVIIYIKYDISMNRDWGQCNEDVRIFERIKKNRWSLYINIKCNYSIKNWRG